MTTVYTPKPGYVPNPLLGGDIRNFPCICGSGKKVKKCCGRPLYVEKEWAEILAAAINGDQKLVDELSEKWEGSKEKTSDTTSHTDTPDHTEQSTVAQDSV